MSGAKICSFKERLVQLIESSGKSQSSIASDFGISKQTLSAWLTGQNSPRIPTITALSSYFDVSITWLMGYDVPMRECKEEKLSSDEQFVVDTYRSLSDPGKQYIHQQLTIASHMFGGKSNDVDQADHG